MKYPSSVPNHFSSLPRLMNIQFRKVCCLRETISNKSSFLSIPSSRHVSSIS